MNPKVRNAAADKSSVHKDFDSGRGIGGAVSGAINTAGKRINTVAREARDIPTAIGTVVKNNLIDSKTNNPLRKKTMSNLGRQVGELGKSITTGKKGTSSATVKKTSYGSSYTPGTKRSK